MLPLLAGSLGEKYPHEAKGVPRHVLARDLDRLLHRMTWKPDKPMMIPMLEDRRNGDDRGTVLVHGTGDARAEPRQQDQKREPHRHSLTTIVSKAGTVQLTRCLRSAATHV